MALGKVEMLLGRGELFEPLDGHVTFQQTAFPHDDVASSLRSASLVGIVGSMGHAA
jgi:hypothetical protein